jgi:hypothetical protein
MSHKRRMDRIADQLAGALRQFVRQFGRNGQAHILELPHPAGAILRRTIRRGRSDRLAPPRCQSVPFAIASDPEGMIILTASGRLPGSRSTSGFVLLVKSASRVAPSTARASQRWLPGMISVLPFNSVVSSIAQNALMPSAGRGRGTLAPLSSKCQGCTVSPGCRLIASRADSRQLCPSSASAKASARG